MASLYEFAGGEPAIHRLEEKFYASVLQDPLLSPLFGGGQPQHVDHLTAFTVESFGGPDRVTREVGGFAHLLKGSRTRQNSNTPPPQTRGHIKASTTPGAHQARPSRVSSTRCRACSIAGEPVAQIAKE
jgi:hypothetical protein